MFIIVAHISLTVSLLTWIAIYHEKLALLKVHDLAWFIAFIATVYGSILFIMLWQQQRKIWQYESMYLVCAWCNKIHYKNEWVAFDVWILKTQEARTSHGICEDCYNRELRELSV